MFNKYPYTDFHELNLDWVISEVQKINASIDSLIDINTIKYADPIDWNVTKQYEKNTVVINGYNTYLSKLPVPAGIQIDNTEYWLLIGNFNVALREVNERVDADEVRITENEARLDDIDEDIVSLKEKDVHIENMISSTWSSTITYTAGTYVTYLDSMYKCKLQNIGVVPTNTTYWELVTVGNELKTIEANYQPKIQQKNFSATAISNGFCEIPNMTSSNMILNVICNGYVADTYLLSNRWYLQVRSATAYEFVPQGTNVTGIVYYI